MDPLNEIRRIIEELNKLPKLKHPELTGEYNDLLWCLDGIEELQLRILTDPCNYYTAKLAVYRAEFKANYIHLLN